MPLDLMLVMPVYNEEACIEGVVASWRDKLSEMQLDFALLILNDGSKDQTARALECFQNDARIRVINKANSGHGPTILQGYRIAVEAADWVFQCDSDDEMKPESFPKLWAKREKYDALFGTRALREQEPARRLLSAGSRAVVRLFFGRGVRDVNTPYRLMRSKVFRPIVLAIPDDTFAPNILISGVLSKRRARIHNALVPHENRKTGEVSLTSAKVWKVAAKSLRQTLSFKMPA
ncbi:Glycosyl transferase family 2 [Abditibacterium utsteinense]|uniref:Glycosyl transferase family 2 n=1 Tax=Abditibacterium utsteinense TaxID=1960156 RepID=A0A2S8SU92_9BACT|nr:glycosyltransferase family 2 protein [Abditibacterium utsteinense]PQV64366.1 Glycosyl transferase family 2 [Abditibacterium utsteinense]